MNVQTIIGSAVLVEKRAIILAAYTSCHLISDSYSSCLAGRRLWPEIPPPPTLPPLLLLANRGLKGLSRLFNPFVRSPCNKYATYLSPLQELLPKGHQHCSSLGFLFNFSSLHNFMFCLESSIQFSHNKCWLITWPMSGVTQMWMFVIST